MTRAEIKELAKEKLGGSIFSNQWLFALLACLIVGVISTVVASFAGIGFGLTIIIAGPLMYGMAHLFLNQVRTGEQMKLSGIFKGFKDDFAQTLLLGLLMTVFISLWSLLLVIPGIIMAYAYSMAFYIKVDHPEYTWKMCLSESKKLTEGHKAELFVLDLSFIGWYFVGSLCLGIGTLWVEPYHEASRALYYEEFKKALDFKTVEYKVLEETVAEEVTAE